MVTLDLYQAAERSKCHPETLRRMMKAGEAPGTKIGRAWVVSEELLSKWRLLGAVKFWRNMRRNRRNAERGPSADQQSRCVAYRARKIKRYVPWANRSAIKSIYREARRISIETGVIHEVDHVLPLCGRTVSGLHVENNLKVIPRYLNRTKGNRAP